MISRSLFCFLGVFSLQRSQRLIPRTHHNYKWTHGGRNMHVGLLIIGHDATVRMSLFPERTSPRTPGATRLFSSQDATVTTYPGPTLLSPRRSRRQISAVPVPALAHTGRHPNPNTPSSLLALAFPYGAAPEQPAPSLSVPNRCSIHTPVLARLRLYLLLDRLPHGASIYVYSTASLATPHAVRTHGRLSSRALLVVSMCAHLHHDITFGGNHHNAIYDL